MKFSYLFGITLFVICGTYTQEVTSRCEGENCDGNATIEEEEVTNQKYYGNQEVNHDKNLDAIVLNPASNGNAAQRNHFRNYFESNQYIEQGDDNTEVEVVEYEGPRPHILTRLKALMGNGAEFESGDELDEAQFSDENLYDGGTDLGSTTAATPAPDKEPQPKDEKVEVDEPEDLEKQKMESGETFAKILKYNQEQHVEGVLEGDMKFSRLYNSATDIDIWPKTTYGTMAGKVLIPYKIAAKYNRTEVAIIKSGMELYTKHTCIRFVPKKSEIAYIFITDAKGCWAYVGKTGYSSQTVSLGRPGCVAKGITAHELMHVVGFQHEHSRTDRDKYVTILEHNIQKDMRQNFDVHKSTKNLVIYDYNSVMHYSKTAFSKFQYLPAIQIYPKRKPEPEIGQRDRMSPYDIEEIKYLYDCSSDSYARCGKDFINERTDSFASPRHPLSYPSEAHCTWKIVVPKGRYVSVTFTKIDIESSNLCQRDAILVHDGPNAAAPRLKVICGTKSSAVTVVSTDNEMFIMFTSDPNKNSFTGFQATFRQTYSKGVRPLPYTVPALGRIGYTEKTFKCDFDDGVCGMQQDTLDELDWIRYRGATPSQGTGPSNDHTTGSGHYIYVESSLPSKSGDTAILRTPWLTKEKYKPHCVQFSYHMHGSYMGTLRLYAYEKRKNDNYGHEVLLWEKHSNQGNRWFTDAVTYRPKSDVDKVQFFWQAYVFFYQSDFGLDDIDITNAACSMAASKPATTRRVVLISPTTQPIVRKPTTTTTTTTKPTTTPTTIPIQTSPIDETSCDFDSGLCGWTQVTTDDFDWERAKDGTPSHNTGPTGDHTSKQGHFLFIEASSPRIAGDVARLLSPKLTTKPHCLQVWYHMYGSQIGAILIKQITNGVEQKLIEKVGNKGDKWLYAEVDVITPAVKTVRGPIYGKWKDEAYTQVAIDGVRGGGYPGDLAIDDVKITSSPCASTPVRKPKVESQVRELSCNFDKKDNLCGFVNTDADNFDWVQHSGKTQSGSTGPEFDHTMGDETGLYLYTEASSPRQKGDNATLVSPKLASGKYCARFYVHMWGSGMGDIRVYTAEYKNGRTENRQKQWGMSGTQGNSWLKGEFEFETSINIEYVQLEFVGTIGHTFTSDAALDDISVVPGKCTDANIATTVTTSAPTTTKTTTTTKPTTTKRKPTTTTRKPTTTTRISTTTTRKPTTTTRKPTTTTQKPTTTTTTTPKPTTQRTTTTTRTTTTKTTTTTTTKAPTTPTRRTTTTKRTTTTRKPTTTTKQIKTTPKPTTRKTTTQAPTRQRTLKPDGKNRPRTRPPTTGPILGVARIRPYPRRPQPRILTNRKTTTASPRTTTQKSRITIAKPRDFNCNFESRIEPYCGMQQYTTDKFDWIRHSGNTPSSGTGPINDHTLGSTKNGNYLFIEGSKPRTPNDNAIITTPALSAIPEERCVVFWYHMYGNGIGKLRVYSELSRTGSFKKFSKAPSKITVTSHVEFELSGEKGNAWRMAKINVKRSVQNPSASLRFHFEGVRGPKFRSDLAIDDICIAAGPCGPTSPCLKKGPRSKPTRLTRRPGRARKPPRTTKPPQTTPRPKPRLLTETTTKPVKTETDLPVQMPFCSFDSVIKKSKLKANLNNANDVMCGWEQEQNDDFDWTRHTGQTPSASTGPDGDHTSGKGHYLFIESSAPRSANDVAVLKSKQLYPTPYCVKLYYNMNGVGTGALVVRAQQEMTNRPMTLNNLKILKGPKGTAWGKLEVYYRPRGSVKNVQFRIEAVRGEDYMSDLAIDDLNVTPGKCDACSRPNRKFKDNLGKYQTFYTGCINSKLFYVKCCSLAGEKIVYKNVPKCSLNSFTPEKLNWMCQYE
ncbi:MAM and LDL-receptor class A domain-containing protein 1-like isoform X1 [Styela clava]